MSHARNPLSVGKHNRTRSSILARSLVSLLRGTQPPTSIGNMSSIYDESVTVTYAEIARWLQEAEHAVLLQVALERIDTPPGYLQIFNTLNTTFLYAMIDKREQLRRYSPATEAQ